MKKLVSLLLVFVMVLGMIPGVSASEYKGSCGVGVNWVMNTDTGVLTIAGNGDIKNAEGTSAPWASYRDSITSVVIGPGVTGIGAYAFFKCKNLTSVSIPEGVTYLGISAFDDCKKLPSVKLPSTLVTIGQSAFSGCDSLTYVELPDSVETLVKYAFYSCDNLKGIKLNDGLKTVYPYVFAECKSLTSLIFPDSVESIGESVADGCGALTTLRIGNGISTIPLYAFRNCKNLVSLYIGTGVTEIGDGAFCYCSSLKNTVLPDGLKRITGSAFSGCDIRQIIIPASVTRIDGYVFADCKNLARVAILTTEEAFSSGYAGIQQSLGTPGFTEVYGYDVSGSGSNMTGYEAAMKYGFYFEIVNEENLWRDYVEPAPDGQYAGGTEENPFKDVWNPNEYYYDPVLWAYENAITAGATATTFDPEGFCKRGQVVTFLYRAMDKPETSLSSLPFLDVNKLEYYHTPILWAYENKITMGTDSTHFSPDETVTRGQFVTFLWRAVGQPDASGAAGFTDVPASEYYAEAVAWAVENGITQGTGAGKFSPNDTCTRAQVVTFLYRLLG